MTGSFKERGALQQDLRARRAEERARGVIAASARQSRAGRRLPRARSSGIRATDRHAARDAAHQGQRTRELRRRGGAARRQLRRGVRRGAARAATREGLTFDPRLRRRRGDGGAGHHRPRAARAEPVPRRGGGADRRRRADRRGSRCAMKETQPADPRSSACRRARLPSMKRALGGGQAGDAAAAADDRRRHRGATRGRAHAAAGASATSTTSSPSTRRRSPSAILLLLEREKTVAEGAGAAPLAALVQGKHRGLDGQEGGGGDRRRQHRRQPAVAHHRARPGQGRRLVRLRVRIPDIPGGAAPADRADRGGCAPTSSRSRTTAPFRRRSRRDRGRRDARDSRRRARR